jgi:hypothetical protein
MKKSAFPVLQFVLLLILLSAPGYSQRSTDPDSQDLNTLTGTVVSSTSRTMVVRAENGQYVLIVLDRNTERPAAIGVGSRVRVNSREDDDGVRIARRITVTQAAAAGTPAPSDEAVPTRVRTLERQIERQMRRYGAGVRAGIGLDPEIITAGLQARVGPFFDDNVSFRPSVEFGFGEVTKLFALNLEGIYRLPVSVRGGRWSAYVGLGPSFNFISRNFEEAERGDRSIDFNDFDFEAGLNILGGVEFRNGMFVELKSTAYSRPSVRLFIGYNF